MLFKLGDKYWVFTTDGAEMYDEIYWPFFVLEERKINHAYQETEAEQKYYFKTKEEAIDKMVEYIKSLKDKT